MHGGKKTLFEYTYCAACFVLIDIQRADLKKQPQIQTSFPLFDEDFSNHQHYETRARQIELHQWQAHDADPSNR